MVGVHFEDSWLTLWFAYFLLAIRRMYSNHMYVSPSTVPSYNWIYALVNLRSQSPLNVVLMSLMKTRTAWNSQSKRKSPDARRVSLNLRVLAVDLVEA